MSSTLTQIKKKVRRLTASPKTSQLSEADLEEYINTFYSQDLPSIIKTQTLHSTLTFYTEANEDKYSFDTSTYQLAQPPVYISGYKAYFSQSKTEFFQSFNKINFEYTGPAGDGTAGPYTFTLANIPITKRDFTLTVVDSGDNTLTVYDKPQALDDSTGDLIDSSDNTTIRGTVNYVTGVTTVTWSNAIPAASTMTAYTVPYTASRPTSMLFFNNEFTLRPIPDKAYKVEVDVYRTPVQLLSDDSEPDIDQWWQYIALGAAIKLLEDRQDIDSIQNIMPSFLKQEALVTYRTANQMLSQRTATIYSQPEGAQGWSNTNGAW